MKKVLIILVKKALYPILQKEKDVKLFIDNYQNKEALKRAMDRKHPRYYSSIVKTAIRRMPGDDALYLSQHYEYVKQKKDLSFLWKGQEKMDMKEEENNSKDRLTWD